MKKIFVLGLVIVSALVLTGSAAAQQPAEGGRVRFTQMVYTNADVFVNGEAVIPNLGYTFTSLYVPLEAGTYTLAVAPAGAGVEAGASVDLEVIDQHRYTIATIGEFETGTPSLLVIDETAELAKGTGDPGSYVIMIHNVADAPAVDVYFNDELIGTDMGFGGFIVGSVPPGKIASHATLAGNPDTTVFESDYFVMPNSVGQASLTGDFATIISSYQNFSYERFSLRSSDLPMIDFLQGYTSIEGNNLNTFFAALQAAGLADIVPGNLPAYLLAGDPVLTTLHGATLTSALTPAQSFTLNGSVGVGLENRVGNGVLYVIDEVLTLPVE